MKRNHKTGYMVWLGGDCYWHRTFAAAERRANGFWQASLAQIIDCKTGELVWGRPR